MPAPTRIARSSGAALAACLVLAGCGGGESQNDSTAQHGTPNTPPSGSGAEPASESLNWAGYVRTGGVGAFTSITGSWVVPDVQCGTDNANSSTWIGIGGGVTGDPTLIQAGTEQDCRDGEKFLGAWWEALPLPQVPAEGAILVTGNYPVA
ncbi:MAG TPA: G1 family glutamic endopeptidase, partial [Solimonas sp.]|nr:G1 family glutamic endopeptidase [Solimonas sp.]